MKKSIFILLFFTLFLHGYIKPAWYPNNQSKTIYSYGDGLTLHEAKQNALENLKTLLVSSGRVDALDNLSEESLEISKKEELENHYFIKVKYDVRNLQDKLKSLLQKEVFKGSDENSTYLIKTPIMEDLNESFGYFPDISIDENKTEFLTFKDTKINITKNDYDLFLALYQDTNITLELKDKLFANEKYFIQITSFLDGYVSLFQISLDNDVEMLFSNKSLSENNNIIFPNFKDSDGILAYLKEDETLKDIFVIALVCKDEKDFSIFNNKFKSKTEYGQLGKFITAIDSCRFTSQIISIEKQVDTNNTQE